MKEALRSKGHSGEGACVVPRARNGVDAAVRLGRDGQYRQQEECRSVAPVGSSVV